MNVLVITSSFLPRFDGAIRLTYDLSSQLVRRGNYVLLLTRRYPSTYKHEIHRKIDVVRVGSPRVSTIDNIASVITQWIEMVKILRTKHFDVIHSHGSIPGIVGIVGKYLFGVPLVITFHSHQSLWPAEVRWKGNVQIRIQIFFEKLILERCDLIVAQSVSVKDFFVRTYGQSVSKKIKIIPNGIDLSNFTSGSERDNKNEEFIEKGPIVLSVGTLSRRKGFEVIIKSAKEVLEKIHSTRFYIVGQGPQELYLKNLAKEEGVNNNFVFTGRVEDEFLKSLYRASDVFVLASHEEFFGLVILEAMAMCKPVISSNVAGPKDIVVDGESGLLFQKGNPKELAKAILNILSDRDLAERMGLKGRSLVEDKYSFEKVVNMHEILYHLIRKKNN